jgi:cholesterol oxidase
LSKRLGQRFSGNGDVLGFAYKARQARGEPRELSPSRGPVITSTILSDAEDPRNAFYLQDAGFPQFASWIADSFDTPSGATRALRFIKARALSAISGSPKSNIGSHVSGLLPDVSGSGSMMPLLGMGMDVPEGKVSVEYVRGKARLTLDWPNRASRPYFEHVGKTAQRVAHAMGADFQANPLQRVLNQLVTVHPLGGCGMGTTPDDGVVDTGCEAFGHPGLYIVDGSVMPGPVGPNPSLTIAAIADRAATHMLS